MDRNIVLVGDALLDNFHSLEKPDKDLKTILESFGYTVDNFATENAEVFNIKNGVIVKPEHISSRKYDYNLEENSIYPFKLLDEKYQCQPKFASVHMFKPHSKPKCNLIVLSIGGNNFKKSSYKLVLGCDYFVNSLLTQQFIDTYYDIVATLKTFCERIVIISPYIPYLGPGSSYGMFGGISQNIILKWRDFIKKIALQFNIPVIDLSLTADYNNRSHYGNIDIYPSNILNNCLAHCISHVEKNYSGYAVYYSPNCDFSQILTS